MGAISADDGYLPPPGTVAHFAPPVPDGNQGSGPSHTAHAHAARAAVPELEECAFLKDAYNGGPGVKLFNVMVHVLNETNRHLGHADIPREELDGGLGSHSSPSSEHDDGDWAAHRAKIEEAARMAHDH